GLLRVVRPVDDVDLLVLEVGHHGADAGAHRPDARPLRVETGDRGVDGDLRAVTRLPGQGGDLDGTVGDLGDLHGEELAHEVGVGPREADLRTAQAALDRDDVD